ncbi:MAG: hypothetical protein GY719_37165 [bacterium]|nr:hypothetical protein [bacterium]
MTREELLERLRGPETGDFEVKAAQGGVPDDAYKTVSAFANTSGGWLVFGVREVEGGFEIIGLDDPDRLQNDFLTVCRSDGKLSRPVDVAVEHLEVDGARVLAFRIEALPRFDKPLKVRVKKQWHTYIRVGSGDHRCTEVEESRFLRDASYETFDATICKGARIEDLDPEAVKWLRDAVAQRHERYRGGGDDIAEFLSAASVAHEEGLTFAAVLLFGKEALISRYKPVGLVDFRLIWTDLDEAPPGYRWDDRIFSDRHLVDALKTLQERFERLCPRPFELAPNGFQHRAESTDFLAVREALVNLLAHQDYTDQHRLARILWYRDRVIFENPGDSLVDPEEMARGGSSWRNPKLVQLLRQAGVAEQAGEGIRNIFRTWERAGRPRPVIENDPGHKLYRLILPWPDQGRPNGSRKPGEAPEATLPVDQAREAEGPRVSIARLPATGEHFVAREAELARLDAAWDAPATHVISLVAMGGGGKSALVNHWLDAVAADGWRGAERVLGWSFYSQGTESAGASSEAFTEYALEWLGYDGEAILSPWKKGEMIARLVRARRTLLVLDGLEPMQHPPGAQTGRVKDPALQALLKELAAQNPGLCVITTRLGVADVAGRAGAASVDLDRLPPAAGADLLRRLGVEGSQTELEEASAEYDGHALALALLGAYLRDVCGGDVRRRQEVALLGDEIEQGGHARRVLTSYEAWFEGPELQILRLMGLFDRSADPGAIEALRREPQIPGLTDNLGGEARWRQALARLRLARLLAPADAAGGLDAHPLVREHFGERLRDEDPEAWRAGHDRLYEHYRQAADELPETLDAMMPLYAAVVHGCRAGRVREAMDEVYKRRILRGAEHFSWKKLGAFGAELTALAGFFERPWDRPDPRLDAEGQAWILNATGFILRALGRLPEAVQPMRASTDLDIDREDWREAARSAGNLSELTLTLGEVAAAVRAGKESVELADRSGEAFRRQTERVILADALHQAGRRKMSAAAFREAEAMQAEQQPQYRRLYSLQGYRYCDLLLAAAEPEDGSGLGGKPEAVARVRKAYEEVRERATYAIEIAKQNNWLLDIALDHLSLGRAHLGLALTSTAGFAEGAEHLDRAVDGLRQAGRDDYIPRGLLARAALRRLRAARADGDAADDLAAATADLREAGEIAERGHMRLHQADVHLEQTRLRLQAGEADAARRHLERARELVTACGYGRREREVAWLASALEAGEDETPSVDE